MGQEYLFLIMNELFPFEKILIFSVKKHFVLLFAFSFVDLEFSFLPLKYFIYFKRRSFCSSIVAKVYAGEKAHFPSFTNFFSICRIFAEIYIIFRSELIRQMNSGPYSLGTDGWNDKSDIKNWILIWFVCLMIIKGKISSKI